MKKILSQSVFTLFCCSFLILLLFFSQECISLASNGLLIWYKNMIPSLFPFMVLSGFMVQSGLSLKIGQWLQPILGNNKEEYLALQKRVMQMDFSWNASAKMYIEMYRNLMK